MHGLPYCASVRGGAACCPAGGCYAVNRCARAATIRCLTIFTIRAVAATGIPRMSHDGLIKNAGRVNQHKRLSAHPRIQKPAPAISMQAALGWISINEARRLARRFLVLLCVPALAGSFASNLPERQLVWRKARSAAFAGYSATVSAPV